MIDLKEHKILRKITITLSVDKSGIFTASSEEDMFMFEGTSQREALDKLLNHLFKDTFSKEMAEDKRRINVARVFAKALLEVL